MHSTQRRHSTVRHIFTASALAVAFSLTINAHAQVGDGERPVATVPGPGIWSAAVASIAADEKERPEPRRSQVEANHQRLAPSSSRPQQYSRRGPTSGSQKVAGAVLGALGGFFAGGMIGAGLDRNCHCDDPGLQGFMVGAPVGAVAGGFLGFWAASR